jgi:hypothetical protein
MSARDRIVLVRSILVAAVLLLPLAGALAAPPAGAAPGDVVWSSQYSFDARGDGFQDVAFGPAGAVYCAGFTKATEETSALLLVKYVDHGATVEQKWVKKYTLSGTPGAKAMEVEVDKSGSVIVAGTVGVAPPASAKGRNIIVLKYSPAGVLKWKSVYNGPAHKDDYVTDMTLDKYGNAYVVGVARGVHTGTDYVTIKVRAGGSRFAGPSGFDEARGVAVDPAGNAYVTGVSNGSSGKARAVTFKYSPAGHLRWGRIFIGNVAGARAAAIALSRVSGATGVIVAGSMWNGMSEGGEALFIKYDPTTGATRWYRLIGNGAAFDESVQSVAVAPNGGLVAVGSTYDENFNVTHGFICGCAATGGDPFGSEYWSGGAANDAQFQALALDAGGSVYAGGWAQTAALGTDFAVRYLYRLIGPGSWDTPIHGTLAGDAVCRAVVVGPGGVYAAGQTANIGSGTDALLAKF